jgi:signal transduction histidine kinase
MTQLAQIDQSGAVNNRSAESAATPIVRSSLVDYFFRALTPIGIIEIGLLIYSLITQPQTVGLVGQGLVWRILFGLIISPVALLIGSLITWRVPGNAVGRLLVVQSLGATAGQFHYDLSFSSLPAVLFLIYGGGLAGPTILYLMWVFPTGRIFPTRFARWVKLYAVIKFSGAALEVMANSDHIKSIAVPHNPLFVPSLAPYQSILAATIGITGIMLPLGLFIALVSLAARYRASAPRERQKIKWVVWAFGLLVFSLFFGINVLLNNLSTPALTFNLTLSLVAVALSIFLTSIGISMFRYQLFDIDLIINRTLVYGSLTAATVLIYIALIGFVGEVIHESSNFLLSLFATGFIAILFQPLRNRLQRGVNRLMYGERDDPYGVLSRLGQRLEETLTPDRLLPTIAETIAQALKLPYAAIALKQPNGSIDESISAYGLLQANQLEFPIVYQSETIGRLIVSPRAKNDPLSEADRRLLEDVARQAGVAAHAVQLTADLQRSRERLVTAREEERRRLRRDLHDGLGPALASITLKLDAARNLLNNNPTAANEMLGDLKLQTQTAITDIRRLVYDLRPPSLDELGLLSALREQVAAYNSGESLHITLTAPQNLPQLPAAVEVAAYRITLEALTNVVKHAQAKTCEVRLSINRGLQIEVIDDGLGLPQSFHSGVGLTSMRERAEELGGAFSVESIAPHGTRVVAKLPVSS